MENFRLLNMKLEKSFVSVLLSVILVLCLFCVLGSSMEEGKIIRTKAGGVHDCKGTHNSAEIESLGRFAIEEHNKKKNALLEFTRVLKAKEQVVAGKIYHLTLEVVDGGKKEIYEAKVWVKPWMNFKQLQEFKHAYDTSSFIISDIGVKQDGHRFGWHEVPIHDPEVKYAANYAIKSLARRSNSLSPYELLEIVLAKAKVVEDYVKLNLLLKVRRGIKEEMYKVEVNKNLIGMFYLSHMEQYHS